MRIAKLLVLIVIFCRPAFGSYNKEVPFPNRNYAELQHLRGSCYPHDTCSTLNGTSSDDHLWNDRTCECGEHCVCHNTCCIDSKYIGVKHITTDHVEKEACQRVQTTKLMVKMVSTCLPKWHTSHFKEKCVSPETGLGDPMAVVPVTSLESGITYKNFFCAWCNEDSDSIVWWNFKIKIHSIMNSSSDDIRVDNGKLHQMEYNSEADSWGFWDVNLQTKERSFHKFKLKFSLPDQLKKVVKQCHPWMVSNCLPSKRNAILRYKCWAYFSPVKVREAGSETFVEYRNIHCALCNAVRLNSSDVACPLKTSIKKEKFPLSFTKLFDVNTKDGDFVGRLCKRGQIYDKFFKKCRTFVCVLPNYVVKGNECVKPD